MTDTSVEIVKDAESVPSTQKKRFSVRMEGPDGGLAWIVALACCMINFIMAGLGRMSGILYVAFIDEFRVGRKEASTPFSLRSSIRNLLGPVVGILGQKYGVRAVTVTGGIVATLSAASCFFVSDITSITVLWGVLNGLGSALVVVLPQVVIGQYFMKHRTTASGMAFSGGCIGSFIFPMLLEKYIAESGIDGTYLIMAGIIMNTIPAAMMLRKPSWLKASNKEQSPAPITDDKVKEEGNVVVPADGGFRKGLQNSKNLPDVRYLRQNANLIVKMLTLKPGNTLAASLYVYHSQPLSTIETTILEELEDMFRCLQYSGDKAQFYKNLRMGEDLFRDKALGDFKSFHNKTVLADTKFNHGFGGLFRASSAPDISKVLKEVSSDYVLQKMRNLLAMDSVRVLSCFPEEKKRTIFKLIKEVRKLYIACAPLGSPEVGDISDHDVSFDAESVNGVCGNGFLDHLKTAFKLHANPIFILVCLCRAVHFVAFMPVMTTVVDFVKDKGLEDYDGKYAIAALSVGDLLGRLCLGWVTDRGYMSMGKYMMVVMVLQGTSTVSLPLMHSRVSLFLNLAIFGMLQGSLFVRHPVIVSKHMKSNEQSIAMGCINFFSGILGFGLPIYIGYFRDTLGSYDYIFYINGIVGALVGLLWSLEPYFLRVLSRKRSAEQDTNPPV